MKNALITTTINVPYNLEAYAKDIAKFGPKGTAIVVTGDKKSPAESQEFCDNLTRKYTVPVMWMGVEQQENFFRNYPEYAEYGNFLPWNCIQRRNAAILYAYRLGAEIIATIDDDNLWEGEEYFKQHGALGEQEQLDVYQCPDKRWFNVCAGAETKNNKGFYPRGFSFRHRGTTSHLHEPYTLTGRRVVNGGLWTGDPDIDAVTRMAIAPDVTSYAPGRITLATGMLCPFNSQNTALHRDVIPAYCLATGLGRYDDIVASYIVKRIADHLCDYISFGEPIVRQVRNKHDLWRDLEEEKLGMQLIDMIVDWLYEIPLSGITYKECIIELIHDFEEKTVIWAEGNPFKDQIAFLNSIVINYKQWMKVT